MSSQVVELLGEVVPQIVHSPPDVHSLAAGLEAVELCEAYGLALDEAQEFTLTNGLGERKDGSWAAGEVADFKPRQNGKGDSIGGRELAGLVLFGERLIIHTAHEFPTANEAFLRLVNLFENYDDLRKKVARIRYANGEQGIEFLSGQRLKYRARTGGSGRGFAEADLVVYDEAQHLHPEHLAASLPTILASDNAQAWYAGSGGMSSSSIAWRLRRRAISGDGGRLAYTENTAQAAELEGDRIAYSAPDESEYLDPAVLAAANPAYGIRIPHERLATLHDALGPDLFARECLNIWDEEIGEGSHHVIEPDVWADLVEAGSTIETNMAWALDVSPDRKWATFAVAGRRADGLVHLEWMKRKQGTGWVVDEGVKLFVKLGLPVRIDKAGPAGSMIGLLREQGVKVDEVTSAEVTQATGQFIDLASNQGLRHLGQSSLDNALAGAVLRKSGDASSWSRRSSKVDITPLVAATVALGGVPTVTKSQGFAMVLGG